MLRFFGFRSSVPLFPLRLAYLFGDEPFLCRRGRIRLSIPIPSKTDGRIGVGLPSIWPTHRRSNAGVDSISVSSVNWQALYLHHAALNASLYTGVTFWVNGGTGGQSVQVQATRGGTAQVAVVLAPLPGNSWRRIPFPSPRWTLATVADFDGFWLQVQNSGTAPTFYVDDITLVTNANPPATVALTSPVTGASFLAPATINLAATVVSNSHAVTKVQFYNGLASRRRRFSTLQLYLDERQRRQLLPAWRAWSSTQGLSRIRPPCP